ncbi:glycosyltransferase [Helicobacter sp. MIT 99-5507]|uniref:glycosyltransferase n=1 Tax=Helicobacter sp. MIT 99-5507 TaxID=152489 RepID=UPI000E1EA308|nr:glycosyltransferase [Helicobacter sp. MIT 99-5507]RDU58582.1 glycosyl transferase family 2 [Helicobacter sp. MIT 99-5507]
MQEKYKRSENEIMQNWSSKEPILTIICITYNHKDFITRAIEGFLEQETNFAFEIFIHDDCSDDGTKEIIESYATKYPNIIKAFYEEENQYKKGANGRYFFGELSKMARKYIALCEGDDYWNDSKKLQLQVDFLENNPKFVITYHSCSIIDCNDNIVDFSINDWAKFDYRDGKGYDMQRLHLCLPLRCVVYRNVIDFLEPNLMQYAKKIKNADTFLWILLGEYGDVKYIKEIKPAFYRIHIGGVWSMVDEKEKHKMHTNSFYNMAEYFSIKGDVNLASYFLSLSMYYLSCASSVDKMQYSDFTRIPKSILGHKSVYGGGYIHILTSWCYFSATLQVFEKYKRAA